MAKFNVVQKKMRAEKLERKRAIHGDPFSGKLKQRSQPISISGKRKRKLLKKWRRDQKEGMEKGLITMEDIQMAVAEGPSKDANKSTRKFSVKKTLKLNRPTRKGKKNKSSKPTAEASGDVMVE